MLSDPVTEKTTLMSETVRVEVAESIATITLNRPDQRNALNLAMCVALLDAVRRVGPDANVIACAGLSPPSRAPDLAPVRS